MVHPSVPGRETKRKQRVGPRACVEPRRGRKRGSGSPVSSPEQKKTGGGEKTRLGCTRPRRGELRHTKKKFDTPSRFVRFCSSGEKTNQCCRVRKGKAPGDEFFPPQGGCTNRRKCLPPRGRRWKGSDWPLRKTNGCETESGRGSASPAGTRRKGKKTRRLKVRPSPFRSEGDLVIPGLDFNSRFLYLKEKREGIRFRGKGELPISCEEGCVYSEDKGEDFFSFEENY